MAAANGTKKFVRVSENSNYRVFELTDVDCISYNRKTQTHNP